MHTAIPPAPDPSALHRAPSRRRTAMLAVTASIVLHALAALALWQFGVIDAWIQPPAAVRFELVPPAPPATPAPAAAMAQKPAASAASQTAASSSPHLVQRTEHADHPVSAQEALAHDVASVVPEEAVASMPSTTQDDASGMASEVLAGENRRASTDATAALQTHILDWLAHYRDYPLAARRARLQGVVQVSATLMPDGRLLDGRIERSSGHRLLDRAALDLLERASPVPVLEGFQSVRVELHLPIAYRMSL